MVETITEVKLVRASPPALVASSLVGASPEVCALVEYDYGSPAKVAPMNLFPSPPVARVSYEVSPHQVKRSDFGQLVPYDPNSQEVKLDKLTILVESIRKKMEPKKSRKLVSESDASSDSSSDSSIDCSSDSSSASDSEKCSKKRKREKERKRLRLLLVKNKKHKKSKKSKRKSKRKSTKRKALTSASEGSAKIDTIKVMHEALGRMISEQ